MYLEECNETLVDEDINVNLIEQEFTTMEEKLQELKNAQRNENQFFDFLTFVNDDNRVSKILDPWPPFSQNELTPYF